MKFLTMERNNPDSIHNFYEIIVPLKLKFPSTGITFKDSGSPKKVDEENCEPGLHLTFVTNGGSHVKQAASCFSEKAASLRVDSLVTFPMFYPLAANLLKATFVS